MAKKLDQIDGTDLIDGEKAQAADWVDTLTELGMKKDVSTLNAAELEGSGTYAFQALTFTIPANSVILAAVVTLESKTAGGGEVKAQMASSSGSIESDELAIAGASYGAQTIDMHGWVVKDAAAASGGGFRNIGFVGNDTTITVNIGVKSGFIQNTQWSIFWITYPKVTADSGKFS